MKLGNYKRIISNDYPSENQPLVEQLGRQLNDGIEQLFNSVGGKLTFDDNFLATVREVEVTVDVNGKPVNQTSILLNNTNIVTGCLVISAVNKSDATQYPSATPFISFTQNGTALYINNITSLQSNNRYLVKIIAFN